MNFRQLHDQKKPLLIGNVWDAPSARAFESAGFQALATSSAALAGVLGFEDGERHAFSDLTFLASKISASTALPFSVDLEAGFGETPIKIAQNIEKLARFGVVGVNLEDTKKGQFLNEIAFSKTISTIKKRLAERGIDVFLNIRTDAFLLGRPDALAETLRRISRYEKAGADGIFTPFAERESDVRAIVGATHLPINLMARPNLPDFETLGEWGVRRLSFGPFLYRKMQKSLAESVEKIVDDGSAGSLF